MDPKFVETKETDGFVLIVFYDGIIFLIHVVFQVNFTIHGTKLIENGIFVFGKIKSVGNRKKKKKFCSCFIHRNNTSN